MQDRLKKLTLYRLILISMIMFMGIFFQLQGISIFWGPYPLFYFLIFLLYAITILFTFLMRRFKNINLLIYIQCTADAVIITGIIYTTGGGLSPFFPLYILVALEAGVILERHGGLTAAAICSISYGILLNMEYYWIVPSLSPRYPYHSAQLFFKLFLAIVSFFLAGYLTGYLAEESRKKGRELKKTQDDYSRLEAFNQYVVQSIQSGLLTIDLNGRLTFLNQAGENILGIEISQFQYRPIKDLFPALGKGLRDALRSRMETTFQRSDGTAIQLGLSLSPLKDHRGKKVGKIIIFQDLTQIKEMEDSMRRSEKMATIGQLAAGIAHEIRNPLASISGAIQLLKDEEKASEDNRRLMEIILAESARLNRLITDFLLYAQPPKVEKKAVNVATLVNDTLEVFSRSPQWSEGIRVTTSIEPDIAISGDRQQLQQVLWNIFINAIDAMGQEGLLEVKAHKNNARVMLLISDTGKGMSPTEKNMAFDPFFTTKEGGSGLGLSIVHKIMESHGARITLESRSDHGTTCTLSFPIP